MYLSNGKRAWWQQTTLLLLQRLMSKLYSQHSGNQACSFSSLRLLSGTRVSFITRKLHNKERRQTIETLLIVRAESSTLYCRLYSVISISFLFKNQFKSLKKVLFCFSRLCMGSQQCVIFQPLP